MRASLVPAALRYVEQVARSGSIQKAARELHVAASAIDRHILLLERDFNMELFERLPRGMRPTAAGDIIIALARSWLADERRAAADLRQLQGVDQGHTRLVVMDSHVNGFLPRLIRGLNAEHPAISLDVEVASPDAALTALVGDAADIAAVFNLVPRREIHVLWSAALPVGCVVAPSHPLAGAESVSFQEAATHRIALQSRALTIRRYLDMHHGWLFSDPRRAVVTNSLQLVKQLALEGEYLAFTSELDTAPELMNGSLVFLPIRDTAVEPQSVSVAIDARRPLSRVSRIVSERLVEEIAGCLAAVRVKSRLSPAAGEDRPLSATRLLELPGA